jgi:superfamily I DNA and/or RNA helicase
MISLVVLQPRGGGGRIGTIHTFQGKEADVVFLVLGTDPPAVGSRQWAGSKPNLLNVAVTRARKAVYVIGDRRLWTDIHYFATLAAELEVVEPG